MANLTMYIGCTIKNGNHEYKLMGVLFLPGTIIPSLKLQFAKKYDMYPEFWVYLISKSSTVFSE